MAKRTDTRAARSGTTASQAARRVKAKPGPAPRAAISGLESAPAAGVGPAQPLPSPAGAALSEFEAGMRLLQEHSYQRAAAHFRNLLASFPGERALLDRVRVYLDLCEREQRKMPVAPSSLEERLTLATAALNDGDDDAAERLAQAVLDEDPDHDLALYLLAAVRSREGDAIAALELLRKAVQVSPDISAQARHDTDFEPLRQFSEFEQLLEPPTRNGHSEAKRARRGASGR